MSPVSRLPHAAQKSIGVATETAAALPTGTAVSLTHAANSAYVHAITSGFFVSAGVMAAAFAVAVAMLPARMRATQKEIDEPEAAGDQEATLHVVDDFASESA